MNYFQENEFFSRTSIRGSGAASRAICQFLMNIFPGIFFKKIFFQGRELFQRSGLFQGPHEIWRNTLFIFFFGWSKSGFVKEYFPHII